MVAQTDTVRRALETRFGPRVRFDELERKLYSHDIGEMPRLMRPLLDTGLAGAVVQPVDERELAELVWLAGDQGLSLVPRGASTSGYGGVLPMKDAVVVDMYYFKGVKEIDAAALTVTVGAATIWEEVERSLAKEGLALRLYPSSSPSSTVAGWLAQGGAGFGSYEYGWFKENVVSARVVVPSGEAKTFSGAELAKIADAEGTTGFITEVTISVRPFEPEAVMGVALPDAAALGRFISRVREEKLPVWSLTFLNPESVRLKAKTPLRVHNGHEVGEHIDLPEAYIAIAVYPVSRAGDVEGPLAAIATQAGGELLTDEQAQHEWDERFDPMKVKRIAPSLIPMEVVIPTAEVGAVLTEMAAKIKQPVVLEGMVAKGDDVVLLGFIPHDQRSFGFNLAYGLSLTATKIAESHGGRVYSTGLYFRHKAEQVLGKDGVAAYNRAKVELDPAGVMNPGKIVGSGAINTAMSLAGSVEPLVRMVANLAKAPAGERFDGGNTKIPGNVAWYAYACAQCGYCVHTCDQFYGRGWESESPRGKFYYLREVLEGRERFEQKDVDRFLVCTTCETCSVRCQLNMPVEESWMELRGELVYRDGYMTFPPFEMMAAALTGEGNIWARYRTTRDAWVPEDIRPKIKEQADVCYFAGCTASYVENDIAEAAVRLLDAAGVEFTTMGKEENCCGIPMLVAGKWDVWEQNMRRNIDNMRKTGAKTVVASCPACDMVWRTVYPEWAKKLGIEYDFEVKHYTEIAAEKIASGELKFTHEVNKKVTFHDSCHIGRASGIYEPPRELIKAIPGVEFVEMEHNREEGLCCGSVLTLIGERPVAPVIGKEKLDEAKAAGAEEIIALCPCCQVQLRVTNDKLNAGMPTSDLARLAMQGLGYEIADSTEVALEAWGPFERFIDLMKPEPMADLMAALFPQMFAAMPKPLSWMMDVMKKVPGGLAIMKPMMPYMLPLLVPMLMPKVMPDMVAEVERRTGPLPDFMSEQMPDLLPKVMDNLMPNMLPLMAPYVVPKMIEYMRADEGKAPKASARPA
jgi:Fe-S oxidoreductase/FAD/FMN-containing dehydrogenase